MNRPEIGVALTKCFYCQEDDRIVLNRQLTKRHAEKVKEMHGMVVDKEPCPKCKGYMEKGIIVITVDEKRSDGDMDNPYRTGGWFVMGEDAICRMLKGNDKMRDSVLEHRMMWLEHESAVDMGLFAMAEQMAGS